MSTIENATCRVCGYVYPLDNPAWFNEVTPSHDICICCGVQFGYEDTTNDGVTDYRKRWLANGAEWFSPDFKPKDWNLENQLMKIPEKWK
ncbi:MAG: hypothetical protein JNL72_09560 [Flavipsychrobacter sp.]|nr:hypothetical protein [Flavipsychrobacter sp.]